MAIHGHTKIELVNVKTGEKNITEKDNIVTDIPCAILNAFNSSHLKYSDTNLYSILPWFPNGFGGIMCFEDPIKDANEHTYFAPGNHLTACCNMENHSTQNLQRGHYNSTESEELENGRKYVYDWDTSQGNGQISCICLTHNKGGIAGAGNTFYNGKAWRLENDQFVTYASTHEGVNIAAHLVCFDENGYGWAVIPMSATTVDVYKIDTNLNILKADTNFFRPYSNIKTYKKTTVKLSTDSIQYSSATNSRVMFFDGGEFIWGFASAGNKTGNATLNWCKIYKSDFHVEEGVLTLNECYLHSVAKNTSQIGYYSNNYRTDSYCVFHNGYLYVCNNAMNGIYKINPFNSTDITLYLTGGISAPWISQSNLDYNNGSADYSGYMTRMDYIFEFGDMVFWSQGYLNGSELIKTSTWNHSISSFTHLIRLGKSPLYINYGFQTGNASGNSRTCGGIIIYTPYFYLATINNLDSPVVKTADMTMKIIYTVTIE